MRTLAFIIPLVLIIATLAPAQSAAGGQTFFVSSEGDDSHPGTRDQPLRTISRGAQLAQPGDTVYVLAGVYRERVTPPRGGEAGKPITYRAEPGHQTFIRGSELWHPQWQREAPGLYSARPEDHLFNDLPHAYPDSHNPFQVHLASTPHERQGLPEVERGLDGDPALTYTLGQVFVNGRRYLQVPFADELEPQTWHYDSATDRIHIHFGDLDPEAQQVEITTRRRIFAPTEPRLGHVIVEGFVLEHCGNQYPTDFWREPANVQSGAVGLEAGHHWVIRNNIIRHAKTFAIDAGRGSTDTPSHLIRNNVIESNYLIDNGCAGIMSYGSKNMIIRDNVIAHNNVLGFLGHKRWEQGGIKAHDFRNGLIEANYIAYNHKTYGVWLDNRFPDARITRNVIRNNGRAGIFLEMSDYDWNTALIDNNILLANDENPIYMHDASGATFVHNLIVNTPAQQGSFGQAIFERQVTTRTASGNNAFFSNIVLNHPLIFDVSYPAARSGPKRSDHNVYDATADRPLFCINRLSDDPPPWSREQFIRLIHADLGEHSPGPDALADGSRARLTFAQWKAFWEAYDQPNDHHSILNQGSGVAYDSATRQLTLQLTFDPADVPTPESPAVTRDFFQQPLAEEGQALPGPFQNLDQGEHTLTIWTGLPIPKPGQLPSP